MNISFGTPNYKIPQNIQNKPQADKIESKLLNNKLNKDKFVRSSFANNNDNLKFKTQKIKFFKEDEEKMANMTLEEQINYKIKLKSENRYTIV